jgi:hypothetical protein
MRRASTSGVARRGLDPRPPARHRAAAALVAGFGVGLVLLGSLARPEALLLAVILAPTDAALGQAVVTLPRLPHRSGRD